MSTRTNNRGFGLIDLLVTLGLVAILATLSIPESGASADVVKLDITGKEIAKAVDLARMEAITENRRMMLSFNASTGIYRVRRDNSGTWEATDIVGYLPDGLEFLATRAVVFRSNGLAQNSVNVALRSAHSTVQIQISAAGGVTI